MNKYRYEIELDGGHEDGSMITLKSSVRLNLGEENTTLVDESGNVVLDTNGQEILVLEEFEYEWDSKSCNTCNGIGDESYISLICPDCNIKDNNHEH